jgi:2'-hydroxyisoflavone reductase
MDVLVLGGTSFLGRHVVERALQRRHRITLFNRGRTNPELFPEVEKLRGDRDGGLEALVGRDFDAVIDTSGFVPRVVGETIQALGDIAHYTFVSTMSVYAEAEHARGASEDAPLAALPAPTEEVSRETYGPLKALCEEIVRTNITAAFIPRPGLIVGPWDPTGRFTYWPLRLAAGGRVLAPSPPEAPVQVIDARDLAAWIINAAERRLTGTYNAVSPPTTMAKILEACRRVADTEAQLVWVDGDFLERQGVGPWMELPLWIGSEQADFMRSPVDRALASGLQIRPLEESARDTLDWAQREQAPHKFPAGLAREKEQRVLDAWLAGK